ncbi:MAG: hypothetical protein GOMPHAMPRED_005500 [Gomphillus americanus]|uniref:NAD(P)-binding protein n=1 Tax=Gomphillus americanus TaxID=1940652 RepID=A0A8H3FRH4_9LECA|nr:MAG: hypothetical protein GOMPHAMPRED_005500 [Gomphillus americanus]
MSLAYHRHWLASQRTPVPEIRHSFAGQTVIVTGSNAGLGFASAKHYVTLGASKVILAVRSIDRGNAAKARIEDATGRAGVVEVWTLDMSSYASIKDFAEKAKTLDRVDVLLENAGVMSFDWNLAVDGSETTMAVNEAQHHTRPNHCVLRSPSFYQSRRGIKSGDVLASLDEEKKFNAFSRYSVTKLLELFYVRELAKDLDINTQGVVVNIANPGMCYSDFGRDMGFVARSFLATVRWFIARATPDGARTLVWPSTAGVAGHGKYSLDCEFSERAVSRFVRSEDGAKLQKTLYDGINTRLEKARPGIVKAALGA